MHVVDNLATRRRNMAFLVKALGKYWEVDYDEHRTVSDVFNVRLHRERHKEYVIIVCEDELGNERFFAFYYCTDVTMYAIQRANACDRQRANLIDWINEFGYDLTEALEIIYPKGTMFEVLNEEET
jgi:hypothetical protein